MSFCTGVFINRTFQNRCKSAVVYSCSFLYSCSEIELIRVNIQEFAIAVIFCGKVYSPKMKTLFRKISVLEGKRAVV